METKKREIYLDFLKIIAILMVLYQHRATYTLSMSFDGFGVKNVLLQLLALGCRCGVPLFFMASGAVLLGKKESFSQLFRHRIVRILIVMAACTLLRAFPDFTPQSLFSVFFTKLNWYLYAYLDYLLMLPLLRLIAIHSSKEEQLLYIIFVAVFYALSGVLAYFSYYTAFLDFMPLFNTPFASTCWAIIFTLTGYFLSRPKPLFAVPGAPNRGGLLLLLGAVGSVALSFILVVCDFIYHEGANVDQLRLHFIFLPSCFLFCFFRYLCGAVSFFDKARVRSAIITVSGTTFGIFLLETHSQLINLLNWRLEPLAAIIGSYGAALVAVLLQFLICGLITLVLKQIPYIKKLL